MIRENDIRTLVMINRSIIHPLNNSKFFYLSRLQCKPVLYSWLPPKTSQILFLSACEAANWGHNETPSFSRKSVSITNAIFRCQSINQSINRTSFHFSVTVNQFQANQSINQPINPRISLIHTHLWRPFFVQCDTHLVGNPPFVEVASIFQQAVPHFFTPFHSLSFMSVG